MKKKIFIYFLILLILGICLTGVFSFINTRDVYYDTINKQLSEDAIFLLSEIDDISTLEDYDYYRYLSTFSDKTGKRVTLIKKDGKVLFDSEKNSEELVNHLNRPEVKEALEGKISSKKRYSNTLKKDMMYVAVPIAEGLNNIGVLRLSVALDQTRPIVYSLIKDLIVSILFGSLIVVFISYFLVKSFTDPIKKVSIFSNEIASGNYSKRLPILRKDELGELVNSLNLMAKQLEYSFSQLSKRKDELESVLSSMINGVIAINMKNEIVQINNAAMEMFNIKSNQDLIGKNILAIIRNHTLYDIISRINTNEDKIEIETKEADGVIYKLHTNIIRNKKNKCTGFIIVIQDITIIKTLENIRKDFVANVSHELKTPITSIKGFIETLREGNIEDKELQDKFFNIIDFEVERLIRLIDDILILSRLDQEPKNNFKKNELINIYKELDTIYNLIKRKANSKNIIINISLDKKLPEIIFDSDYFKQMMINLIDNAIKYTNEDGEINVKCKEEQNQIVIIVEDNGIGIPKEDIPRLFERFYRVDKGRSRNAGGTGLGLAIVKHILYSQNASIKVESKIGKGSKFIVSIPISRF